MYKGEMNMSRWYGSLQNRLMERGQMPKPEVGMGATELCWSDRHPYEVVEVIDDRHIVVRPLKWRRIDDNGFSESQEYEYESNPEARTCKLFLTKQGEWRERIGRSLGSSRFAIGFAERYYDFSF